MSEEMLESTEGTTPTPECVTPDITDVSDGTPAPEPADTPDASPEKEKILESIGVQRTPRAAAKPERVPKATRDDVPGRRSRKDLSSSRSDSDVGTKSRVGELEWLGYLISAAVFLGIAVTLFVFFVSSAVGLSSQGVSFRAGVTLDAVIGVAASMLSMLAFGVGTVVAVAITFYLSRRARDNSYGVMKSVCFAAMLAPLLLVVAVVIILIVSLFSLV